MVTDDFHGLVVGQIPNHDLPVAARTRDQPVERAYAQYAALMHPSDHSLHRPRRQIPLAYRLVARTRKQHLHARRRVRVQLQTVDSACMRVGRRGAAGLERREAVGTREETAVESGVGLVEELVVGLDDRWRCAEGGQNGGCRVACTRSVLLERFDGR